jgi:hypothetical protein
MLVLVVTLIVFLLGLAFISRSDKLEGFRGKSNKRGVECPDILLERDGNFYLYTSSLAKVPGVNPLQFSNLEDYVEFMEWQRSQGIRCPVLYLQRAYDAQGGPVYKARSCAAGFQPGLPDIELEHAPARGIEQEGTDSKTPAFNAHSYPGFDAHGQDIGKDTPIDRMFHESAQGVSANPMDANWGGRKYTQAAVDAGVYDDDNVALYVD